MALRSIHSYANSMYLYRQFQGNSSDSQKNSRVLNTGTSGQSDTSVASKALGQSLTEQLSGLVRLTRYAMDSMGLSQDSKVTFSKLKDYCEQVEERFSSAVKEGLSNASIDPAKVSFTLTPDGSLRVDSSSSFQKSLAQRAIDGNSAIGKSLLEKLKSIGIPAEADFTFSLGADASVTATGSSAVWQPFLQENNAFFASLASSLGSVTLDPNIDFTLNVNEDDSLSVNCANKEYQEILEGFFRENPSIVSDFKRTEALSNIEKARKFMQLPASKMRTRLQIESIARWWDTSGNRSSFSSFGTYSNGIYSRLNGVNVNI